ncbi:MAG: tetratricopeptide repeat protein [Candidatus Hodarchaeales archaeon]|jgi:tetratricopeptide (TPR) repeat protein
MIDIKKLFEKGQIDPIIDKLKVLEENHEFDKLPLTKRIEYKYYQSRAFEQKGLFNEALEVATQYRSRITASGQLTILPLIVAQSYALRRLGSLEKALTVCQEGEKIIESFQQETDDEIENAQEWIAHLLHITGSIYQLKGELETALDYCQRSLAIREKVGNLHTIATSLNNIGIIYSSKGESETALDYYQQSLTFLKKIGNPLQIAKSLNNIGQIYRYKGELETALDFYSKSLTLFEEIGNPQPIAASLNNLGLIYWNKGELETALDYYQQSLTFLEKIGDFQPIAISLNNIGQVYLYKGKLDTALDYFHRSLAIREKIGNLQDIALSLNNIGQIYHFKGKLETAFDFYSKSLAINEELGNNLNTAETVFNMIQLSLDQEKQAQTLKYLTQLEEIDKQMSDKRINLKYRLAKALQLKQSRRIKNKIKAQELLAEIVAEEVIDFSITSLAMIHFAMLLITEFKTYGEHEVMEEVKSIIYNLYTLAKSQQSHFLIIHVLILRSKFAMIAKDLDRAFKYLDQALLTAKESKLSVLQNKVETEKIKLKDQLDQWKVLLNKKSPFQEMIDQAEMTSYLKEIQKVVTHGISKQMSKMSNFIPRKKYQLVYQDALIEKADKQKHNFRVGIAQIGLPIESNFLSDYYEEIHPKVFGLKENKIEDIISKIKEMIELANSKNVNILLFSELAIDFNHTLLLNMIMEYSSKYNMYIIPGSYHNRDTRRNISLAISPEGILWTQEKHIPATITYEGQMFTEGIDVGEKPRKTIVCDTIYGRIAIIICRDFMDMDLRVELKNFEPPVDLIFNPSFTPVTADFNAAHFDARRSIYAYCFFANIAEFGDSLIYTPEKERIVQTVPKNEEGLIFKDVDLFKLRSERKKWELNGKKEKPFIQSTR